MADRYDPKVSVRPMTDRKGSDARPEAGAEDPLFELARIVSGRGSSPVAVPAAAPSRGRPVPASGPAAPPAQEPDILGDLEAELLSDLQASFAAVKEAIDASAPPDEAEPPPAPAPAPPPRLFDPPRKQPAEAEAPSAPPQPSPPEQPQAPVRPSAAARPPLQPPAPPGAATAQPAMPRERPQPTARSATGGSNRVEIANLQLRPTAAPEVRAPANPAPPQATEPPPAARPSRWDRPAEPPKPKASAASRFAPPRAAQPTTDKTAPPPLADDELPFGEGLPFASEADAGEEEFPLDGFDMVPGYGDEDQLPPYPDDELEPLPRRGVPRSLAIFAGVLAVVLVGVLAVVMLRPGTSDTAPPIITADSSPTKVAPPDVPVPGDDQQNKLIYDRVDSGAGNGTADTTLVTPGSEPIAPVPSTDTSSPIARVILPGGPTADQGAAGIGEAGTGSGTDVAMNDGGDAQSIGPRKVRTVIVRPDGTIVSSDAAPAEGDAPASVDAAAAPAVSDVPPVPSLPADDDTAAIAGGASGQELAITALPGNGSGGAAAPSVATPAPVARVEPPAPAPTPAPQPKPAAPGGNAGPIDLTPGRPAAQRVATADTGPVAVASGGGMMVQVSSQRSEDAANATYRDLQGRYPSILGGYSANIQRADLGDRGIYYRVRVGPFAPSDAQQLCDALKSAGGDCILAQR